MSVTGPGCEACGFTGTALFHPDHPLSLKPCDRCGGFSQFARAVAEDDGDCTAGGLVARHRREQANARENDALRAALAATEAEARTALERDEWKARAEAAEDALRATVAEVTETLGLTAAPDAVAAQLDQHVAGLAARLRRVTRERDEAEALAARLGDLLRATADALKGPPPPLSQHSTHDLPEVAAEMRRRDEYSTAIVAVAESMKAEHAERARELSRFRGQACYTASVARRLLPALEAHGADGWPLDRVAVDALAAEVERLRAEFAVSPPDEPEADGTDAAHPAWWRGNDAGCKGALALVARLRAEVDALKAKTVADAPQGNADRAQLAALAPKPPRVVFLHRPKELDPGEREAAARHFVMAESRLDVRAGDVVIARHFAWPWPRELFGDLRRVGARPVNDARGHAYAADLLAWTADLGALAPSATDRFETLPERGPFVVKGEKADKGRWSRMFAETKADAIRLRSELMADSGMRNTTIIARQYVALAPLGAAPIPGACPPSVEFRVFVAFGRVLSAGYYWPPEDCDAALFAASPKPGDIPAGFLAEAVARVSPHVDFFTLDVGVDRGGRWWVIEVSDGLRAGMSENDPAVVYAGLAGAIAAHYGDAAQLAALAGARFAEEHPAAAGIVGNVGGK